MTNADLPISSTPPTEPGLYWFKRENETYEMIVEVSLWEVSDLIAKVFDKDIPVADLKGEWRGPIKTFPRVD